MDTTDTADTTTTTNTTTSSSPPDHNNNIHESEEGKRSAAYYSDVTSHDLPVSFKPKDHLAAFGGELDSQPSEDDDMALARHMGATLSVDAELDKEDSIIDNNTPESLVDTTTTTASITGQDAKNLLPKHVANSELSPISGGSTSNSPDITTPEIPLNAHISRVSFLGEKAFSADNTDSSSSVEGEDSTVETLDSDALSSLDVSLDTTTSTGRTTGILKHSNVTEDEVAGEVTAGLTRALQTSAVELCVEIRGFQKSSYINKAPRSMFVVLFLRGASPGTWEELDRTEGVIDPRGNHRWVHKMRLPAATTLDRSEHVALGVFEDSNSYYSSGSTTTSSSAPSTAASVGSYSKREVKPEHSIGYAQLRVAQILQAPSMALDVECISPRKSMRVKGTMYIAADLVPHLAHDELLSFDIAFEKDAPARNRILYVISRAVPKGRWSPIYRSEVRTKDSLENFRTAVLTNREVNSGNDRRLLRIEFYRYYKNRTETLLGFCQTSLLSLRTCVLNAGIYWWPAQDGIPNAKVVLTSRSVTEDSSTFVLRVVPATRKFNDN